MNRFDHDVIIIGGGPAGSTAAAYARLQGLSVCVVERLAFPRFRIGESLLPNGNAILHETGVWPKLAQAGFIEKFGASFHLANGAADKEVIFSKGLIPGLSQTYQVDRAKFDALLLDHARELGATVEQPATVKAVAAIEGGHRVTISTHTRPVSASESDAGSDSAPRELTARWVLDCGGRENHFPHDVKRALDPSPFPKRVAIYSHFENVFRPEGIAAGHTVIVRLADGWFWLIPIDATRTSVGLVTTVEAMRRTRGTPAELFNRAVESSVKLRELMQGSAPTMEFHVTSDYSYFRRDLATERMLLLGDAGGFFDPIFSSGVYVAMNAARDAVALIAAAQRETRALTRDEQTRFTEAIKKRAKTFQQLIACFYDNDAFSVFMVETPPLRIGPAINSIVAGCSQMPWPVLWRFRLFLFICRVQPYFPFVPRIDFTGMEGVAGNSPAQPSTVAR